MNTGKKVTIVLITVLFLLTAGAYGYGVFYFSNHFMPGSMINGFNCSYMSVEETEELLSQNVKAYVLTLHTRNNGIESITAEQAGFDYAADGAVKMLAKSQDIFLWFRNFANSETYDMSVNVSVDEGLLQGAIQNLNCMQLSNTVLASDAFIKETENGYEIVPEVQGTQLNFDRVRESVILAAENGVTEIDLDAEGCYEAPVVFQDDEKLIANCEFLNAVTDIIITYDFADRTEVVDKDVIKNWVIWDAEGYCTLDKDAMELYVSNLAYKYDTVGSVRNFRTYNGREIVIEGGDYGWVIDQEAEVDALANAIFSGETQVREPVYSYAGWCRDSNDIGYSYLEVDLTNQRMVLYLNGKPAVDTKIVSGNPNLAGAETPTGCYSIDNMASYVNVNCDGFEANVNYFLNFAGSLGIHDASWRTQFGDNLHIWEGSYGCIHVPYGQMPTIYANVGVGFPVVIYK